MFRVERIGNAPILVPHMDEQMGANLAGPSLVRVPDWAPDRLGRYDLYFAHHNGEYIRLAYADQVEGPWHIHTPGSLQHSESHFPLDIGTPPAGHVLAPGVVVSTPHIASPDVHVDEARREFRMYYHGIITHRTQRTRVATSRDGVHFEPREPILGTAYWLAFKYGAGTTDSRCRVSSSARTIPGTIRTGTNALRVEHSALGRARRGRHAHCAVYERRRRPAR
ncbi:MAG: hypothetical protein EXR66_04700 [Dehalococcoidia bacterium]|nr:hypothetical protein [Dehalococcoidia bacterium]